ncbi:MAG: hypothetical protein P8M26_01325 [Gammaproteobacteria bacterium]|nr:hypothetical protein [Gammaproteobacteria bacterium]
MRREIETFDDGAQTVRLFDANNRLVRIETYASGNALKAAIHYLYDKADNNVERIVYSGSGEELRRLYFDADGNEIADTNAAPVRWAAMDGSDEGFDPKGSEQLSAKETNTSNE